MQRTVNLTDQRALGQHQADTDIKAAVIVDVCIKRETFFLAFVGGHDVGLIFPQPRQHRHDEQVKITGKVGHNDIERVTLFE